MMQSDLFILSVAGPFLSVSSDFLFHVSSTLPPPFHYPCGLFVLVPRSFETRRERSSCTHAVLFDRFPLKKTGNCFSCRCLSRCLIRSTSSSADERRNVGSATYAIEKVSTRKIPRYPLLFDRSRDVYWFRGRTGFDLGWLEAFYNRRTEKGLGLEGLFF